MLRNRLILSTLLGSALFVPLAAQSAAPQSESSAQLQREISIVAAAGAGAALGGPLGMAIGTIGSVIVGEIMETKTRLDVMNESVLQADRKVVVLEKKLRDEETRAGQVHQFALDVLNTRILFDSGSDQLTEQAIARIASLSKVLRAYPAMQVRLDGHADPRGTDEYNNVLSHYRAESVRKALQKSGVEEQQIDSYSHGASQSNAPVGDYNAYASERRVEITVTHPRSGDVALN